jgi:hypothetical protein
VARGFVHALGGQLVLEDTPRGGLTVVVDLPTAADGHRDRRARQPHLGEPQSNMTSVLVLGDELQFRRALTVNLNARGYNVEVASNGGRRCGKPPSAIATLSVVKGVAGRERGDIDAASHESLSEERSRLLPGSAVTRRYSPRDGRQHGNTQTHVNASRSIDEFCW